MVDCADRDRIDEARQELHRIINDREMKDAIILIFANKQDLPDGMYMYVLTYVGFCVLLWLLVGVRICTYTPLTYMYMRVYTLYMYMYVCVRLYQ